MFLLFTTLLFSYKLYKKPIKYSNTYNTVKYIKDSNEIINGLTININGHLIKGLPNSSDHFSGTLILNEKDAYEINGIYGNRNKYIFGDIKGDNNQSFIYFLDDFKEFLIIGDEYNIAAPAQSEEDYWRIKNKLAEVMNFK